MKRPALIILLILLFVPVVALAQVQVGQQAVNFTLTDMSGSSVSLTDYQGHNVVLYFFTSG